MNCYWGLLLFAFHAAVSADEGLVKTVAGGGGAHVGARTDCLETDTAVDGVKSKARLHYPWGIVFDPEEDVLYVADCGCPDSPHSNDRIRTIHAPTGKVTALAGSSRGYKDGFGPDAQFHHPAGMAISQRERILYIADSGNDNIRAVELDTAKVRTFLGNGKPGYAEGVGIEAQLENPQGLTVDDKNRRLYVSDTDNHAVRVVTLPTGNASTLAGGRRGLLDGVGSKAKFYHPTGISLDPETGILYVADHYNHAIRTIDTTSGAVRTLAGGGREGFRDGRGREARFHYPEGLHFDAKYQVLYVVEFDSNAVRMVTTDGVVSTLAGGSEGYLDAVGTSAKFFHPTGLTLDPKSRMIYVTDQYNHMVRSITTRGSPEHPNALSNRLLQRASGGNDALLCFTILSFIILLSVVCCRPLWRKWCRSHLARAY